MKTFLKITLLFFSITIIIVGIWFVLQLCLLELFGLAPEKEIEPEVISPESEEPELDKETEIVYGIEMSLTCSDQLKNFLKDYGRDYSPCFKEFVFDAGYCGKGELEAEELSDVNVLIILDSSGSMAAKLGGTTRIDIAKKAVLNFFSQMPEGVNTSLVVYGHKGSNSISDKEVSCQGIEEVVKLGKNNYKEIISAVNSFNPKGWTPLAKSLEYAKNVLKSQGSNNKNYLILVSDGIESCDGNPIEVVKTFKSELSNLNFVVIGFMADQETKESLEEIVKVGEGTYLQADNSSMIAKGFQKQLLLIKKDCLNISILKSKIVYDSSNLEGLQCWIENSKKEWEDFNQKVLEKVFHSQCKFKIVEALKARQAEFWAQKQKTEEKNEEVLNKIKTELNNQLKILEGQKID